MTQDLFSNINQVIGNTDKIVADLINAERCRQGDFIPLIPSENYISSAVALTLASSFGNKYSEGYPYVWKDGEVISKSGRYYQGQANTNEIEKLVIERAKRLFTDNPDVYHANVQVLSGAPANLAVLNAFLNPGETFMGLALDFGGHLTHGHKVSITSKFFKAIQYTLNEKGELDYDEIEQLAKEYRPKLIICGATAYPLQIDFEAFGRIAKSVGAILVADISHICGLCVSEEHPHPFPYADIITTTTHKILRGPRGGLIICKKEYGQIIDKAVFPGLQGGPHMNTIASIAVALEEALRPSYKEYAKQVVKNAKVLADELKKMGFNLVCDKTENHLILLDVVHSKVEELSSKNGSWLAERWELAGLVANKNTIPGDPKPFIPSGVRLGTPAVTTLGMKEIDMLKIADFIMRATIHQNDEGKLKHLHIEVKEFLKPFIQEHQELFMA